MEELTLTDYLAILRRWNKVFVVTGLVILVSSMFFVAQWKNYRSTATVQIEEPEVAPNAQSAEAPAERRISEIEQKVLSTGTLAEIIAKFNLYAKARASKPIADIAEDMRKKIKLDFVSASGRGGSIAFTVSFDYSEPLICQRVTDELVTRFLDEDLKARRSEAQLTSAFYATQIEALEASLSEQEKKIAEFHEKNGTTRPENFAYNQQAVNNLAQNIQSIDTQLATISSSLTALRTQFVATDPYSRVSTDGQSLTTPSAELKALKSHASTMTAQYGPEHPDVVKIRNQIAALQSHVSQKNAQDSGQLKAQIEDVRTKLEAAQKTYSPEHPDVVAMKSNLKNLENTLASQKSGVSKDGIIEDADNPAYLQLVAQLHILEEQQKTLTSQRADLQAQLDGYQKLLTQNPQAEQELAVLTRDYDNAQSRYREIKEKKMMADMNTQVEQDRKGQRLSLINPPALPIDTQPKHILLILGSIIASLIGALAGVAIAQLITGFIIGSQLVELTAGSMPLVEIPHIYTKEEISNSTRHRVQYRAKGLFLIWANRILNRVDPEREIAGRSMKKLSALASKFSKIYAKLMRS